MKKVLAVLVVAIIFYASLGLGYAEDPRIKVNLDLGYFSGYVSNIGGATIFDHQVFQQGLSITDTKTGIYGRLWTTYSPKGGLNSDYGDEMDYIVGIYRTFFDGKLGIDFGYEYLNLYNLADTRGDLHGPYLSIFLPEVRSLKPYLFLEKDFPMDKAIVNGDFIYRAGVKYDLTVGFLNNRVISLDLSLGGHDSDYSPRQEIVSFARLGVSSIFKATKWMDITPSVNFQKRLGYALDNGGATKDNIWYGVNVSIPVN